MLFETAASHGDARAACGHLASLVMANRGIEHTPLALLANHMKAALFVMHTSSADVPGQCCIGMRGCAVILFSRDGIFLLVGGVLPIKRLQGPFLRSV